MRHVGAIGSLALLILAPAGCVRPARDVSTLVPTISGHWTSTSSHGLLDLALSVRGAYVTGTGTLSDSLGQSFRLTVTGQYAAPTFSLQFVTHDYVVARYVGRLDSSGTMRGMLQDSGPPTDSLILARPPAGARPQVIVPH